MTALEPSSTLDQSRTRIHICWLPTQDLSTIMFILLKHLHSLSLTLLSCKMGIKIPGPRIGCEQLQMT